VTPAAIPSATVAKRAGHDSEDEPDDDGLNDRVTAVGTVNAHRADRRPDVDRGLERADDPSGGAAGHGTERLDGG
jgi:hypothetical protein